ncbi:MAG: hypothetical protein LUC16_02995, partial [Coprobacillus sp.]|nr:hypothetical protein [Coprobacillus sp.]
MKKSKFCLLATVIALSLTVTGCNSLCGFFNLSCGKNKGDFYTADVSEDTYNEYSSYNIYGIHYPKSTGNLNVLVIPVTIAGYEQNATEENRQRIYEAFFGTSETTGWESVSSYYYKSSYGQLNIGGYVTDWYECGKTTKELYDASSSATGMGSVSLLKEAVAWAKQEYPSFNFSIFDSDNVGLIDAVMLIYSAPNYSNWDEYKKASQNNTTSIFFNNYPEANLFWAFTYWDQYTSGTHADPAPHGYSFMSYDFMDEANNDSETENIKVDAHTYIHEFGHILGLDDYYDYDNMHSPLCGVDMM